MGDDQFLPDFFHFIGHRVRDIFMQNTQRFGSFCVETEEIANKLSNLFNIKNFSCRGRKLKAQKLIISPNVFCIQLSNINHAITLLQFTEWVKSTHSLAFNIKLNPVQIIQPNDECIISFNEIDAAIAVKKELQNKQFRDFDINFAHWHVPRRNSYPPVQASENEF